MKVGLHTNIHKDCFAKYQTPGATPHSKVDFYTFHWCRTTDISSNLVFLEMSVSSWGRQTYNFLFLILIFTQVIPFETLLVQWHVTFSSFYCTVLVTHGATTIYLLLSVLWCLRQTFDFSRCSRKQRTTIVNMTFAKFWKRKLWLIDHSNCVKMEFYSFYLFVLTWNHVFLRMSRAEFLLLNQLTKISSAPYW